MTGRRVVVTADGVKSGGVPDGWVKPKASSSDMVGIDGNAFSVIGFVARELRAVGNPTEVVDQYMAEAKSAGYDWLLAVSVMYLDGNSA
jgi:hypothetical protein